MEKKLTATRVALISLAAVVLYSGLRMASHDWDPLSLAWPGTRFQDGDPSGTIGYDGQFAYYIALNPAPEEVAPHLDIPAYRYQRILYPILARVLALGLADLIPWTLLAINLAAHALGTWAVGEWLAKSGHWPGYALIYGLWVGLVVSVGLDLNEPLAYALIAGGWLASRSDKPRLGAALLGLSLFAKETGLFFWAAGLVAALTTREQRKSLGVMLAGGVGFVLWQIWISRAFGVPGLGSGGEGASPFEWIPLMGLARIGEVSRATLVVYLLIFGPTIIIPAIWGLAAAGRALLNRIRDAETWSLFVNSLALFFVPFSTFREPLGLLRFATGLVLSVVYFSAKREMKRPLNYGLFWIILLVILLNG